MKSPIFAPQIFTCLCGRVVSKSHLPTGILTCLWTSGRVLTKALGIGVGIHMCLWWWKSRPVPTEHTDLVSVSVTVSQKFGLHSNMQKCVTLISVILPSHVLHVLMWTSRSVSLQPLCSIGRLFSPHMFFQVLMWSRRSVSLQPLCSTGRLFFPHLFYTFWCEPVGVSRFSLSALLVGYSFLSCFYRFWCEPGGVSRSSLSALLVGYSLLTCFSRFWCDPGGVSHFSLSALLVGYSFLSCFTGFDVIQEECLTSASLLYWSVILSSHVLQVLMWLRRSVSLQPLCSTSRLFFPHMFYRFWCDSGGVSRSSLSALLVGYSFLTCFTGFDVTQEECLTPASLLY